MTESVVSSQYGKRPLVEVPALQISNHRSVGAPSFQMSSILDNNASFQSSSNDMPAPVKYSPTLQGDLSGVPMLFNHVQHPNFQHDVNTNPRPVQFNGHPTFNQQDPGQQDRMRFAGFNRNHSAPPGYTINYQNHEFLHKNMFHSHQNEGLFPSLQHGGVYPSLQHRGVYPYLQHGGLFPSFQHGGVYPSLQHGGVYPSLQCGGVPSSTQHDTIFPPPFYSPQRMYPEITNHLPRYDNIARPTSIRAPYPSYTFPKTGFNITCHLEYGRIVSIDLRDCLGDFRGVPPFLRSELMRAYGSYPYLEAKVRLEGDGFLIDAIHHRRQKRHNSQSHHRDSDSDSEKFEDAFVDYRDITFCYPRHRSRFDTDRRLNDRNGQAGLDV